MAIGDLYTAQLRTEGAGSGFTTSMAYRQTAGTNDQNTLTDLADELGSQVSGEFKDCFTDEIDFTAILIYQVTGSDETPGRLIFGQPNPGTVAGAALPMGAAVVLSFLTDAPSARFNGRMYMGAVPEIGSDDGLLTAAQIILYDLFGEAITITPPPIGSGLAEFQPVTISRILDGVPRVPPIGFTIESFTTEIFVKNQRRRNTRFLGAGPAT